MKICSICHKPTLIWWHCPYCDKEYWICYECGAMLKGEFVKSPPLQKKIEKLNINHLGIKGEATVFQSDIVRKLNEIIDYLMEEK